MSDMMNGNYADNFTGDGFRTAFAFPPNLTDGEVLQVALELGWSVAERRPTDQEWLAGIVSVVDYCHGNGQPLTEADLQVFHTHLLAAAQKKAVVPARQTDLAARCVVHAPQKTNPRRPGAVCCLTPRERAEQRRRDRRRNRRRPGGR